jgi:hypothetical protein
VNSSWTSGLYERPLRIIGAQTKPPTKLCSRTMVIVLTC